MKFSCCSTAFARGGHVRLLSISAVLTGLLLLPCTAANAQVRLGPKGPYTPRTKPINKKSTKKRTQPIREPGQPEMFRLKVDRASEPVPALKYQLLPRHEDRRSGNAAPYYYRALLSMNTNPSGRLKPLHDRKNYSRWMNGSLDAFPKDEVARFLTGFQRTFENLQTASRRETCDWSWRLEDLNGGQAVAFIIEEVQESRNLARLLILKIRVAIVEKRYDDAIEWMRVGYKLAEDVARPPTLINDLVGVAIAAMITAEVRNLIAAPKSPNLYWALASLPSPLIDIRPAMQYEMSLPMKVFPEMKDAETANRSAAGWSEVLAQAVHNIRIVQGRDGSRNSETSPNATSRLAAAGLALRGYPNAKRDLIAWGIDPKKVNAMSVGQAVVIHQARVYRHAYQEMMKWTFLPYHQAARGLRRSEEKLKLEGYLGPFGRSREIIPLTSLLLPATTQAYQATARVDARIAGLRVLEAVRMHAAANGGRLPGSLDEIRVVPVPTNPATGKPYPYRVAGKKAILDVPAPFGRPNSLSWRIEFTVR